MKDFYHLPVMIDEVLAFMEPAEGHRYVDGTVGGGGHASEILRRIRPSGWLLGCDHDAAALAAAHDRLHKIAECFELKHGSFSKIVGELEPESMDGALVDLGVSSHQLDTAERGFSFQKEGPLDMRMDQAQPEKASDIVATFEEKELADLFWKYSGEKNSRKIARAICQRRRVTPITRTLELAELIAKVAPNPHQKIHPATRVFQALRMYVNREVENIEHGLHQLWRVLKVGGKLAIITFHSIEVQIVKKFYQPKEKEYRVIGDVDRPEFREASSKQLQRVTRKPVVPSDEECQKNSRARSAQLRVFKKIALPDGV